ncbi:M23 family metallopeptidase [Sphingomonas sp.]|uniref:M23 family metallopeptidase n=1 Tax=Sphingomonas sp. TaxID=28214 RepID=UPI003AFF9EF8
MRGVWTVTIAKPLFLVAAIAAAAGAAPAYAGDVAATTAASIGAVSAGAFGGRSDPTFHALFEGWGGRMEAPRALVSVPSQKPVREFRYTSSFGVRSDPFNGSAHMHAGMDLAAPIGTPVYATADGTVGRAEMTSGGYGNLVQLEHGKGIETRYGHLSQILVHQGQRVRRGDLIALMGSTGRSTGSHLHYEVRIDGRAVNPMPFLQTGDYLQALQNRTPYPQAQQVAMAAPQAGQGGD